jgi:transcriptional regulator with XRE-family HTH domain
MPRVTECAAFSNFGTDVKEARNAMNVSRRVLAEMVNIDPRYLANIENSGSLPSLPVFYELVTICKLPVDRYFYPKNMESESEQRKRVNLKTRLCPERFLTIVEHTLDGAIKSEEAEETE